jgi:hypothetical protein
MTDNAPPMPSFVELPPFLRYREEYLNDEAYRQFQLMLIENPEAGPVIRGSGGLRKVRFEDKQRGKGKRGGLRVIYYFWVQGYEFWMFTLYNKDEMEDLSDKELTAVRALLEHEIAMRTKPSDKPTGKKGK